MNPLRDDYFITLIRSFMIKEINTSITLKSNLVMCILIRIILNSDSCKLEVEG
jgi:hypothetical protein